MPAAGPWVMGDVAMGDVATDVRGLPPVRHHRRERSVLGQEGWLEGCMGNVRVLKDESKFAGW